MAYRFLFEIIADAKTAYFIKEYELNVPKIAIEAVIQEISRQQDIRKVTQVKPVEEELEDLKRALTSMREQRDKALSALPAKREGLLARLI